MKCTKSKYIYINAYQLFDGISTWRAHKTHQLFERVLTVANTWWENKTHSLHGICKLPSYFWWRPGSWTREDEKLSKNKSLVLYSKNATTEIDILFYITLLPASLLCRFINCLPWSFVPLWTFISRSRMSMKFLANLEWK